MLANNLLEVVKEIFVDWWTGTFTGGMPFLTSVYHRHCRH